MDIKEALEPFKLVARYILADIDRAEKLIKLLASKSGVVTAVQAVIAGIDKQKKIPPELAPLLAIYIFSRLLDMAKQVEGTEPPKPLLDEVMTMLLDDVSKAFPLGQQPADQPPVQQPPQQAPQPPAGLIGQGVPA